MKGTWDIVLVRKYHALECTPELLETSRLHFSKQGYNFKRELIIV
jgi:hypothetical protein